MPKRKRLFRESQGLSAEVFCKIEENQKDFTTHMSNYTDRKGGEGSMEQAELLMQILAEIRQQNAMLQSTIDTLREQSRQKDEEIERLRQIILNLAARPTRTAQ